VTDIKQIALEDITLVAAKSSIVYGVAKRVSSSAILRANKVPFHSANYTVQ
jgi:hypothetical protein